MPERVGAAALLLTGPLVGVVLFALTDAWVWLVVGAALLPLARLAARRIARDRPPRTFAEACCHRAGGALRAGPPPRPPAPMSPRGEVETGLRPAGLVDVEVRETHWVHAQAGSTRSWAPASPGPKSAPAVLR